MKKKFRLLVVCLLLVSILSSSVFVSAGVNTVTKTKDLVTVKLKYTSYVDNKGRKLVKNGSIVSVKGGNNALCTREFYPKKSTLKRIDGGRTYLVTVTGTYYHNYLTGGVSSYEMTYTVEFCYKK